MVLAAVASLLIAPVFQEKPRYEMVTYQLVTLSQAPNAPRLSKEDAARMQGAHVAYLQSLWEQNKALVAGPIASEAPIRGIVILDVRSKEEAERLVREDPLVKRGVLAGLVRPWYAAKGIVRKGPRFLDLEPMWIGVLVRPPDAPAVSKEEGQRLQAGHMANIERMAAEDALVWAGPFQEDTPWRGIFVFRNLDHDKLFQMVARDPAVAAGRLKMDLYPWMTTKGSWPPPNR